MCVNGDIYIKEYCWGISWNLYLNGIDDVELQQVVPKIYNEADGKYYGVIHWLGYGLSIHISK